MGERSVEMGKLGFIWRCGSVWKVRWRTATGHGCVEAGKIGFDDTEDKKVPRIGDRKERQNGQEMKRQEWRDRNGDRTEKFGYAWFAG